MSVLLGWSPGCIVNAAIRTCEGMMLRVTVEERGNQVVFRVEGKLKGPWVTELARCWRSARNRATGKTFGVDLDGVDFVDDQGQALLSEMASAGVELIATGLIMSTTVVGEVDRERTRIVTKKTRPRG
jgi:ABC-type transporter Mla MlaB component